MAKLECYARDDLGERVWLVFVLVYNAVVFQMLLFTSDMSYVRFLILLVFPLF